MNVQTIMSQPVVTVELDDPLSIIREIFGRSHFHHLLVVDGKKLVGIISDRDLFKALSPNLDTPLESNRDAATLRKRAHQIMTRKLITLPPHATILEAVQVLNTNDISCIPIVDEELHAVGIVSWRDILRSIEKQVLERAEKNA